MKVRTLWVGVALLFWSGVLFGAAQPALGAPPTLSQILAPGANDWQCFCYKDISVIQPDNVAELEKKDQTYWQSGCKKEPSGICDQVKSSGNFDVCAGALMSQLQCTDTKTIFEADLKRRISDAKQEGLKNDKSSFIPECALKDELTAECKDVGIFVILGINVAKYLFSIIGVLALAAFMYGGFVMILSQGNSEKVSQGKEAIGAAFIGLVVAFGGYLLIQFLSTALNIGAGSRLL